VLAASGGTIFTDSVAEARMQNTPSAHRPVARLTAIEQFEWSFPLN
jgi:hypothetical protein